MPCSPNAQEREEERGTKGKIPGGTHPVIRLVGMKSARRRRSVCEYVKGAEGRSSSQSLPCILVSIGGPDILVAKRTRTLQIVESSMP